MPHPPIYNHEAPALNRYEVLRSQRRTTPPTEEVVAADLTWGEATKCSETLQKQEQATHPERTSWAADIFFRRLQAPGTDQNPS